MYCLETLADVTRWNGFHGASIWPIVLLVYSLKSRAKLGVHKALQFLGDVFYSQNDEDTAAILFTLALEGFTYMDVHRSKAECMLRLGDISKGHGNLLKAVGLWEMARPLFERSSQANQVAIIDKRLTEIGEDVREQYRSNMTSLAEFNTPMGPLEQVDNDLLNMEEEFTGLNFGDEPDVV
jgi:hypothetical protein